MRLNACDVVTRLTSEKASTRMGERGWAAHGVSAGRKCWPVDQRFRPARTRLDDLLVKSPQALLAQFSLYVYKSGLKPE